MAIKSVDLGGTDWVDGNILFAEDLIDTIEATVRGGFNLTAIADTTAENNSFFLDSADNVLKIKDNSGEVLNSLNSPVKIYEEELTSNGNFSITGLSTSQYNHIEVMFYLEPTDSNNLRLVINGDNASDNYSIGYTSMQGTTIGGNAVGTNDWAILGGVDQNAPTIGRLSIITKTPLDLLHRGYQCTHTESLAQWSAYGFWRSTAEVTQIDLSVDASTFVAGSKVTIYGYK